MKRYTFCFESAVAMVALAVAPVRAQLGVNITPPAPLQNNAALDTKNDQIPTLATDGNGNWVAVWQSEESEIAGGIGTDSDILVARSMDNGATWTDPIPLNTNADVDVGKDVNPQIATDGNGNWVAVWQSEEPEILGGIGTDRDILFARSTDNGATWTDPVPLNTNAGGDDGGDFNPQISTDGSGIWVVAWSSTESEISGGIDDDEDILVSRSNSNGAMWSAPVPLNTNADSDTGADFVPRIATDGQGNWVAAWYSKEPDILGGIGTDYDILVSSSTDDAATWTNPVPLNNNAADDTGEDQLPIVATDGLGHWLAVWYSNEPDINGGIGTDLDILMARSEDNGLTWTDPAPLNTNAGDDIGDDLVSQIATDTKGFWVAAWLSDEPEIADGIGPDFDILVARSTDNGTTWTKPVPLNTNAADDSSDDFELGIAADKLGNWVAVWYSEEPAIAGGIDGDEDILVTRFALPDCNDNGIGDGQDIAEGTSTDADGNGVPDECKVVLVGQPNCGAGMCGAGAALPLFVSCLVVPMFRRRRGKRVRRRLGTRLILDPA